MNFSRLLLCYCKITDTTGKRPVDFKRVRLKALMCRCVPHVQQSALIEMPDNQMLCENVSAGLVMIWGRMGA